MPKVRFQVFLDENQTIFIWDFQEVKCVEDQLSLDIWAPLS